MKGFLVGNGVTNYKYDTEPAFFEMSYWFGMIDDDLYNNMNKNCDLSFLSFDEDKLSTLCKGYLKDFEQKVAEINVYDVFGKCYVTP